MQPPIFLFWQVNIGSRVNLCGSIINLLIVAVLILLITSCLLVQNIPSQLFFCTTYSIFRSEALNNWITLYSYVLMIRSRRVFNFPEIRTNIERNNCNNEFSFKRTSFFIWLCIFNIVLVKLISSLIDGTKGDQEFMIMSQMKLREVGKMTLDIKNNMHW